MADASGIRRRDFLGTGLVAAGALAFGPGFWRQALAAGTARLGPGPYGELQPADANGLMLPKGFRSRIVAQANQFVPGTTYRWPVFPDGKATFAAPDGGYVVVVNSEARPPDSGASAIRFDRDGKVTGAYRILGNTSGNCAGGPTPWGTWLSCEETDGGHVWECDPSKPGQGVIRPALGTFNHEAAAVDPVGRRLYLTEDKGDGGFYRFTPARYPDLSEGLLEVAVGGSGASAGAVRWVAVPDPAAIDKPTRQQVQGMAKFSGGEGIWFDSGVVYFACKGDNRIFAYDTAAERIEVVYDRAAFGDGAPLSGLDNVTVSHAGELFVCEDGGDMEIGLVTRDREVARFLRLTGPAAEGSEIAGVIFDPSATRMYFSSQRALGFGITYEVTGPFLPASPGGGPAGVRTASGGGGTGGGPVGGPVGGSGGSPGGSSGGGGTSGEDVDVRGLRIRAPRRVSLRTLRREGLRVSVELGDGADVVAALRTDDLRRVPGKRGSVDRPDPVTLGKARREDARKGRLTLRVRVGPKRAATLRRRQSIRARITVVARDRDGRTRIATRLVRVRISGR